MMRCSRRLDQAMAARAAGATPRVHSGSRTAGSRRSLSLIQPTAVALTCTLLACAAHAQQAALVPFEIVGDAIAAPLGGKRGDATRGRASVFDADKGNCVICHPVPGGDARAQGNVAPTLGGVAARLSEGQIRLRLVDGTRINPSTIMPPYYRVDGLNRVGAVWQGKPALGAAEIEDIIAFLSTFKE